MVEEVGEDSAGHTRSRMSGRVQVIARVSGRRTWSVEQKLAMLRDAFGPGGSVREAMDRHEVSSGLLYTWRKNAMAGLLIDRPVKAVAGPVDDAPSFAQVVVADQAVPSSPAPAKPAGRIAIELPRGMRLAVDPGFDAETLARVLAVVGR